VSSLREKNPVAVGVVGLLIIVAIVALLFNPQKLPVIGGGRTISANFAEASGLMPNDPVRIAGVPVGKVTGVALAGDHVHVKMLLNKGVTVGSDTSADIRIKTLLGQMYIALTDAGTGSLGSRTIPVAHTTTPLIVTDAFQGLSQRVDAIDTTQLAKSFTTLADTFRTTAPQVGGALTGLSRLSTTIASRDDQLKLLLGHAKNVTQVLANRDAEITKLIDDSNQVLTLLDQQREVIHSILINTVSLSQSLTGLITENRQVIGPALTNLKKTTDILQKNQDNLDSAIHILAPYLRDFTNLLGNGRWFDTYIANLGSVLGGFTPTAAGASK
jgi:phospholipid/cholesterol/gamma-HCH transport system substrate-binding protein